MITHTLKTVVDHLHKFSGNKEFRLVVKNEQDGTTLGFNINKLGIDLVAEKEEFQVLEKIFDIEMLRLPENVTVISLTEISEETGETSVLEVKFEAQLFIKVFRLMKDRVIFLMNSALGSKRCHYINRKLYYVNESEDSYTLVETNLYKFHKMHGNYEITAFSPLTGKVDNLTFVTEQCRISKDLGKTFSHDRD